MQAIYRGLSTFFTVALVLGSLVTSIGCERREKVIDVETPAGEIEVERSTDSGKVDVDIDIDKKK
jgi:hypothetical protein